MAPHPVQVEITPIKPWPTGHAHFPPPPRRFRVLDFLKAPAILEAAEPLRDQLKRALALRLTG